MNDSLQITVDEELGLGIVDPSSFEEDEVLQRAFALQAMEKEPTSVRDEVNSKREPAKSSNGARTKQKSSALKKDPILNSRVRKEFEAGWFNGTVVSYDKDTKYYKIIYEDGDKEDMDHAEVQVFVQNFIDFEANSAESIPSARPARRQTGGENYDDQFKHSSKTASDSTKTNSDGDYVPSDSDFDSESDRNERLNDSASSKKRALKAGGTGKVKRHKVNSKPEQAVSSQQGRENPRPEQAVSSQQGRENPRPKQAVSSQQGREKPEGNESSKRVHSKSVGNESSEQTRLTPARERVLFFEEHDTIEYRMAQEIREKADLKNAMINADLPTVHPKRTKTKKKTKRNKQQTTCCEDGCDRARWKSYKRCEECHKAQGCCEDGCDRPRSFSFC